MDYDANRALKLLRIGSGKADAVFREGQEDAIRHVVDGRGRLLVVQKTGWGKSFVYFIAAKLLREQGGGPALLISPLLALIRNQIAAATRMGVDAATINFDNRPEWDAVKDLVRRDAVDILLISPERLANADFIADILGPMAHRVSLLVIDEAHCISDWGHDFRPDYQRITSMLPNLPNVRLLGTTATANDRVLNDLRAVLGPNITVQRGPLHRPSLLLQTLAMSNQAERLAWLSERLHEIDGAGIIYTLTRRDARLLADWLKTQGLKVEAYMGGGNTPEEKAARNQMEDDLLANRVKALAATTALSMGFDKPDLAFVIHYQRPQSVVHYYQQVGRAGRALDAAHGVLLSGAEDQDITDFFIDQAFPTRDEVRTVLNALEQSRAGYTATELQKEVNIRPGRINQILRLLELETPAPVVQQRRKWQLTATRLSPAFWERTARLTELRRGEQQEMARYADLTDGHMEFLIKALDGTPEAAPPPNLIPLPTTASAAKAREAVAFLRRYSVPIPPRKQWSDRKSIRENELTEPGRALCYWGDAGWGNLVRSGKYSDNRFADELVSASAQLIREWRPNPAPVWVTCIPSRRRPNLVPDFAERLASALGLPFRPCLVKTTDRPEQKSMANSAQQSRNVEGSLELAQNPQNRVLPGAVLLVDDMVDSRWTFTVAASLLRQNGCRAVFPFALANTGSG